MIARLMSTVLKRSLAPFVFRAGGEHEPITVCETPGLYVHVPFCRTLCSFCPYYKERYDDSLVAPFTEALVNEIRIAGSVTAARDANGHADLLRGHEPGTVSPGRPRVTSVYYGGGTPALLLHELPRIQRAIRDHFAVEGGTGIELHPDDVTRDTLRALRDVGFTMVSLGMQSFSRDSLRSLGRENAHGPKTVALAASAGFDVVDVDLIFGMGGQQPDDIARDIHIAADAGATQISTYPLIAFSFTAGPVKRTKSRERRALLDAVLRASAEAGFERTSVWTFGRADRPRYSSVTRDSYRGFGPSAATLLRERFSVNAFSASRYILALREHRLAVGYSVELSRRERSLFWLFWHAYNLKIERNVFREMFGMEIDAMFGPELRAASRMGIVAPDSTGYRLTDRGANLFHHVEQLYTDQYIDRVWRLAHTTSSPDRLAIW